MLRKMKTDGHNTPLNEMHICSICLTTDNQIKTKYGQVREQDRVRLNNRVEQQLIECGQMARDIINVGDHVNS